MRISFLLLALLASGLLAAQDEAPKKKPAASPVAKKPAARPQKAHRKPSAEQIRRFNELQKKRQAQAR